MKGVVVGRRRNKIRMLSFYTKKSKLGEGSKEQEEEDTGTKLPD